jgi:CO/xanthine dehydrogenase Mo-binding subunit
VRSAEGGCTARHPPLGRTRTSIPLGVKGLGEIALLGLAPAIAHAGLQATAERVRTLPIRIEDVLTA